MTDRELLKEAMKSFEGIASIPPEMYSNDVWAFKAWAQSRARFMVDRIEQHLADHSPDAGNMVAAKLVEDIRSGGFAFNANDPEDRGPNSDDYHFTLTDSEAAALIESYGRRVPKELLSELFWAGMRFQKFHDGPYQVKELIEIATKYGVKIEEDGK